MKKIEFEQPKIKKHHFDIGLKFRYLDELIDGLNEGELITIAARSGQGKSTLARNIIVNLNQIGEKILIISTEETEYELAKKLNKIAFNLYKDDLFLEDKIFTIEQIEQDIRESKAKIVVIDYIQQLEGNIRDNTKLLKQLAIKYKCVIFILSQLNRGAQNKIPDVSMLSKSDNILHDSDQVGLLTTTELKNKTGETLVLLDVAKNRKGKTGKIGLALFREEGSFADVNAKGFEKTNEALAQHLAKKHPSGLNIVLDQLKNIYIPNANDDKPFMMLKNGIIF